MKRNFLILLLAAFASLAIVSCGSGSKSDSSDDKEDVTKEYDIMCDNQIIKDGPGEEFGGIINEPATKAIGMESYYAVWSDDRVEIIEEDNEWVKVKLVTGPNRIEGWIPETCLDK